MTLDYWWKSLDTAPQSKPQVNQPVHFQKSADPDMTIPLFKQFSDLKRNVVYKKLVFSKSWQRLLV